MLLDEPKKKKRSLLNKLTLGLIGAGVIAGGISQTDIAKNTHELIKTETIEYQINDKIKTNYELFKKDSLYTQRLTDETRNSFELIYTLYKQDKLTEQDIINISRLFEKVTVNIKKSIDESKQREISQIIKETEENPKVLPIFNHNIGSFNSEYYTFYTQIYKSIKANYQYKYEFINHWIIYPENIKY